MNDGKEPADSLIATCPYCGVEMGAYVVMQHIYNEHPDSEMTVAIRRKLKKMGIAPPDREDST